jgi:uncharacterized protein
MRRNIALRKLRAMKKLLARHHVNSIAVFGSVARDEAGIKSDIDLLVGFSKAPGLLDFVALQRELSQKLGRKVDLVTADALHPRLKDRILAEAVYA